MKVIRGFIIILTLGFTIVWLSSCGDNNNPVKPVITGDTSKLQSIDTIVLKSFSPDTVTTDTTIILTGLNFTKDTILSVMIGDSSVKFVVLSDDSIAVSYYIIEAGDFKVIVKSKAGTQLFEKLLKVRILSLSEIFKNAKSFKYSLINVPSIESYYSYYRHYPDSASIENFIDTLYACHYYYNSSYSLKFDSLSKYEFTLTENVPSIEFSQIKFTINKMKFDYVQILTKDVLDYSSETQKSEGYFILMHSLNYSIVDNSIVIDLYCNNAQIYIDSLTYNYNYFYMHGNTTSRNEISNVYMSPSTDSTRITITISR